MGEEIPLEKSIKSGVRLCLMFTFIVHIISSVTTRYQFKAS